MKPPPDKVVEYFFQFVLITSGIVTTILLVTAVTRLFVADTATLYEYTHPFRNAFLYGLVMTDLEHDDAIASAV